MRIIDSHILDSLEKLIKCIKDLQKRVTDLENSMSKDITTDTKATLDNVVYLTYFKPNGKYYSSGAFKVYGNKHISEICEVVRSLMQEKQLPDLIEGHSDFDVLVQYQGVPHFIRATHGGKVE